MELKYFTAKIFGLPLPVKPSSVFSQNMGGLERMTGPSKSTRLNLSGYKFLLPGKS